MFVSIDYKPSGEEKKGFFLFFKHFFFKMQHNARVFQYQLIPLALSLRDSFDSSLL